LSHHPPPFPTRRSSDLLGNGVATLDHAFVITGWLHCPATEPEPVITPAAAENPVLVRDALWPSVGDPSAGRDVAVSVVDTGLLSDRKSTRLNSSHVKIS